MDLEVRERKALPCVLQLAHERSEVGSFPLTLNVYTKCKHKMDELKCSHQAPRDKMFPTIVVKSAKSALTLSISLTYLKKECVSQMGDLVLRTKDFDSVIPVAQKGKALISLMGKRASGPQNRCHTHQSPQVEVTHFPFSVPTGARYTASHQFRVIHLKMN